MTLRILQVDQRSDEWYEARRGIVTASAVGKLITIKAPSALDFHCPACPAVAPNPCQSKTKKGVTIKTPHSERVDYAASQAGTVPPVYEVADNDTSRGLTNTLAVERITGWTEETPMTSDMWRGVEHEPFARDKYAEHYAPVTEVGFLIREDDGWRLGYSPDGLVGDDGLLEIKCPRAKTHLSTILADEVPAYYMAQLQAGLLVSGRKWIDFVSFVAGMPLYRKRIEPDPAWFAAITGACIAFEANVTRIVADYEKRVAGMPMTERISFEIEVA
jgi:phage FluMu protein Com